MSQGTKLTVQTIKLIVRILKITPLLVDTSWSEFDNFAEGK